MAQEVRELIIDVIGEIGGHFGANLGACELAVALHSLLDSPRDKIIWDVGHQAYPHKVLTGRRDRLDTIRQYGGLAPFCSVFESEHDIMGAGHASTSIGYAVGLKEAMRKGIGTEGQVIAVIGDGALTGGVAYEALHNAGGLETPIVIVLNDNGMSISPNVGALARYFQRFRLNPTLYHAREGVEERLTRLPLGLGETIERLGPEIKAAIKAYAAPGLLFEELDLAYVGVIDGHDVGALRRAIGDALGAQRPVVVHIHTVKGKGFAAAEEGGLEGMEKWHAAKPKSIVNRVPAAVARPAARQGDRFAGGDREAREASALLAAPVHGRVRRRPGGGGEARSQGDRDHRGDGGGDRARQALQGAAGAVLRRWDSRAGRRAVRRRPLAPGGEAGVRDLLDVPPARLRPDRPRRLPAGAQRRLRDGPGRPGGRRRPHPSRRLRRLLLSPAPQRRPDGAARRGDAGPHAAHGAGPRSRPDRLPLSARRRRGRSLPDRPREIPIGTGELLAEGERVALLGYGYGVQVALRAAGILGEHDHRVTVADGRFAKPLDAELVQRLAREHELVVTIEENVLPGGFGAAVLEHLEDAFVSPQSRARVMRVGLPDRYVTHGKPALLREEVGFTGEAVAERVLSALRAPHAGVRLAQPLGEPAGVAGGEALPVVVEVEEDLDARSARGDPPLPLLELALRVVAAPAAAGRSGSERRSSPW